jgi:heme exporter protein CcmD
MSLQEFVAMGGYAKYVWPAYFLTAGVLIVNVTLARRSLRAQLESVRRRTNLVRDDAA